MKKIISAILLASMPTVAHATPVFLTLERMTEIKDAASTICRIVADEPGSASAILERRSSYLQLTTSEKLYLNTLCLLYLTGRVEGNR